VSLKNELKEQEERKDIAYTHKNNIKINSTTLFIVEYTKLNFYVLLHFAAFIALRPFLFF